MRHFTIPLALLGLAACGHSTQTRFWTLDAAAPASRPVSTALAPVRVDAVHVPLTLDRLEIIEQTAANRITVHDFDRWSAPLGDLIRRTLTQDLAARLPAGSVVFPSAPKPAKARTLTIDILDLRPLDGRWMIDAGWTLSDPDHKTMQQRQLRLTSPPATPDVAGQTAALSQLVGQLADRIADGLAARDPMRPATGL